jgi:hypothetical protein
MSTEHLWNDTDRAKVTYSGGKPVLSATMPTTNLTRTDLVSQRGLRGDRLATDRLSRGTAFEDRD